LQDVFADIISHFIFQDEPMGYYFFGNVGTGKTEFLCYIAKILKFYTLAEMKYISMPRLTQKISSIRAEDQEDIVELEKVKILFIDNMGLSLFTERQTELIRDFFDTRYRNQLPCFIASNINLQQHCYENTFYHQMADYLNDSSVYKIIYVDGESYRK
jgi:DNA replication protein DnaC